MSRIGKNPVNLPPSVEVRVEGDSLKVKGPLGELGWHIPTGINLSIKDRVVMLERASDSKNTKALHGTARSIIANMVRGVSEGYQRVMDITGIGYRAQVQGNKVLFTLGYSHPVEFTLPDGVSAEVDKKQTQITLKGIDKQLLGEVASNIRSLRSPDSYKGKGVRYAEEFIKLKPGKTGKK
ncbi:MAG: 50S ribosomal protein L6 [Thermodesulfovibrionia bacterium]